MKHRPIPLLLGGAAALLLASTVLVFFDLSHRLHAHYGPLAEAILLRTVLLCLMMAGVLALVGLAVILLLREKARALATERRRFYLLSHFANTYLFEYDYQAEVLRLSDNLPAELDAACGEDGTLALPALRRTLHGDDWGAVVQLVRQPPEAGQERGLELRLRHRDGAYIWYACKAVTVRDGWGKPVLLLGRFEDIGAQKAQEAALIARSTLDDLTGLLNRRAFTLRVEEWLASPRGAAGGTLLMLDLDDFKSINDTCGHATGDRALRLTAQVLRETFRDSDILARAGGDEFLIFLPGTCDTGLAGRKAEQLCTLLSQRSGASCAPYTFSCSVGASFYPRDGRTYAALFQAADEAMYRAKREGKGACRLSGGRESSAP